MSTAVSQIITAMFGSLGFGILFNLRGRRLLLAGLGGLLSWIFYLVFYHFSGNEILCYGLSTILTTIYSQILARVIKSPATVFLVPSVVPLLPGGYLYYAMLAAVSGDWNSFMEKGVLTLSSATAIAVGMMVGSTLFSTIMTIVRARRRALEGKKP